MMTLLLAIVLAHADGPPPGVIAALPPVEVEVGGTYETLTGGHGNWADTWVTVRQRIPPRTSVYGTFLHARRWNTADNQIRGGAEFPLGDLGGHLTATHSPDPAFLPHWGVGGDLRIPIGDGWSAGVGGGYDRYPTDDVTHQFGRLGWRRDAWGVGYQVTSAQVADDAGFTHRAWVTAFYAPGSHASVGGGVGRMVVAAPGVVRLDPVHGVSVFGVHRLWPGFGLSYDVGIDDHGTYSRTRLQVGFRIL